jgi:hypothetical protein
MATKSNNKKIKCKWTLENSCPLALVSYMAPIGKEKYRVIKAFECCDPERAQQIIGQSCQPPLFAEINTKEYKEKCKKRKDRISYYF